MSVSAGSLPLSVRRRLAWLGHVTTFLALLGALLPGDPTAAAEVVEITGQARVIDGDTVEVAGERIRLFGIDAPESKQTCEVIGSDWACGRAAKAVLTDALVGREVTCKGKSHDRYGRLIAKCYLDGEDINARMVREGWALAYRKYSSEYVPQEMQARAASAGMWRGQFADPWDWRKQKREQLHVEN